MQPFELLVGWRYTRAKRRNHFISFISLASMLGIALGITALITVMSVMNGFEKEVRARILGVASHVQIAGGDRGLEGWSDIAAETKKNPEVVGAAPYVMGQGLLTTGQSVRGVVVRGIDPALEGEVADIGGKMMAGSLAALKPGEFGIVLGVGLSRSLRALVGDKVTVIAPQGQVTPAGLIPRLKQFTVVGIFRVDHHEFDNGLAMIHLADAQVLYRLEDRVSGVRLKLKDLYKAPEVTRGLARSIKVEAYLTDWTQQNANYFRAIQIEKRMMFIILTLIIAVAAFNLVSTLVMVVTDKHPDIAILRTLGASPGEIMRIFVVQGTLIGVVGTFLGVAGGIALALNVDTVVPAIERLFHFQILSSEVYYITELPSDLHWQDVWSVAVVSLLLAFAATLYPSWRASRVNPAEALRYE
ncbi:lipoprotein-releasing ABC transporter permease subunit [Usitatibacter palustris]|uniref:Lipoprotein-releasing system transmembrane protein LolE n=1 Tax=Usitatibacter palustris TaxID=2732487 RepID=A0A6M4HBW3_9PROT|nr:lipoprotein-releasing ABC transporter permease subunit [Usitatibacter palustris]QJR15467.1 Lipoprotein-releasing system transmembrane protein LolE [Usitatibacter palustris]